MISTPVSTTQEIWPCVLSIMASYFTATTVDVHTQVDITPIVQTSQWTFYLNDKTYQPQRNTSVDLLVISENIDKIYFAGTYRRVIAVTENLTNSLPLWMKKRLADTVVINPNGSSINAYTWFPYRHEDCWNGIKFEFLSTCLDGTWNGGNFYPNKIPQDFGGCPVIYQAFPTPPENNYDFDADEFSGGRELDLMKILAVSMNLTVKMMPHSWYFHWYPENVSAMYRLEHGEIDFAFGSLTISNDYAPHAQSLPSHCDLSVVWMLPRARPRNKATNIYSGFPWDLWSSILIVLILTGLTAGVIAWTENHKWNWLDLIAALIGSPISYTCRSTALTAFIFLFQIYSMHIAWFYQSCLLGNLYKVRMDKQIRHPREAAAQGLNAVLFVYHDTYFNHTDHEMWNQILSPGRHHLVNEQAEFYDDLILRDRTFSLSDLNRDGYALRKKYKYNLKGMVLTVPFMNNPVTVYSVRGSPLTERYTLQMGYALQSGLYEYFKKNDRYSSDITLKSTGGTAKVLTLFDLVGAFFVLGSFLGLSSTVFIGEVLCYFCYGVGVKIYKRLKRILPDRKPRPVVHVMIK